jgi:hypothetical protein
MIYRLGWFLGSGGTWRGILGAFLGPKAVQICYVYVLGPQGYELCGVEKQRNTYYEVWLCQGRKIETTNTPGSRPLSQFIGPSKYQGNNIQVNGVVG